MTLQNLTPPVFPLAGAWNHLMRATIPAGLSLRLHQLVAEPAVADLELEEMQIEENAGLGFGVSLLLIFSVLAEFRRNGTGMLGWKFHRRAAAWLTLLRWLPLVSLLALLSQSQVGPLSRILVTYYALLLPAFLAGPAQATLIRRRWWRLAAGAVFLLAGMLLVITPARPLFPAKTIFSGLAASHPQSSALLRAAAVYDVYHERNHAFAPVVAALPPGLKILGIFTYDDPEASLWQPFGRRRIIHICPEDTPASLGREGIRYALINTDKFKTWFKISPEEWLRRMDGVVLQKIPLKLRIREGVLDWWLVKLP